MDKALISPLVNRCTVGAALALARQECAHDSRWLNAVNRAALNLEACPWQFDGDILLITSATDATRNIVTRHGCH